MSANHPTLPERCLLTLMLPQAREDAVLDLLARCPELTEGHTLVQAQGLGHGALLQTPMERVQGRARRALVQAIIDAQHGPALLQRLRAELPTEEIVYWITPVLAHGTLA